MEGERSGEKGKLREIESCKERERQRKRKN